MAGLPATWRKCRQTGQMQMEAWALICRAEAWRAWGHGSFDGGGRRIPWVCFSAMTASCGIHGQHLVRYYLLSVGAPACKQMSTLPVAGRTTEDLRFKRHNLWGKRQRSSILVNPTSAERAPAEEQWGLLTGAALPTLWVHFSAASSTHASYKHANMLVEVNPPCMRPAAGVGVSALQRISIAVKPTSAEGHTAFSYCFLVTEKWSLVYSSSSPLEPIADMLTGLYTRTPLSVACGRCECERAAAQQHRREPHQR